jgi:Multicopper oxidase
MPASLLWFHDHGLGATRLNVFAGLAAAYIIRDQNDTGTEPNPIGIPGGAYEIPLVIQDRQFNPDGTMLYPRSDIAGVTWIGEYFGDVMLVNGKVWPFLKVEPRLYRFRILNGCNARILDLRLGGVPMWQIGAEGGMWDKPVPVTHLVLAPAERADVIADFSASGGQQLGCRCGTVRMPPSGRRPGRVPARAPVLDDQWQAEAGYYCRAHGNSSGRTPGTQAGYPTVRSGRRVPVGRPVLACRGPWSWAVGPAGGSADDQDRAVGEVDDLVRRAAQDQPGQVAAAP